MIGIIINFELSSIFIKNCKKLECNFPVILFFFNPFLDKVQILTRLLPYFRVLFGDLINFGQVPTIDTVTNA